MLDKPGINPDRGTRSRLSPSQRPGLSSSRQRIVHFQPQLHILGFGPTNRTHHKITVKLFQFFNSSELDSSSQVIGLLTIPAGTRSLSPAPSGDASATLGSPTTLEPSLPFFQVYDHRS